VAKKNAQPSGLAGQSGELLACGLNLFGKIDLHVGRPLGADVLNLRQVLSANQVIYGFHPAGLKPASMRDVVGKARLQAGGRLVPASERNGTIFFLRRVKRRFRVAALILVRPDVKGEKRKGGNRENENRKKKRNHNGALVLRGLFKCNLASGRIFLVVLTGPPLLLSDLREKLLDDAGCKVALSAPVTQEKNLVWIGAGLSMVCSFGVRYAKRPAALVAHPVAPSHTTVL
jgi:hypothetical protein